MGNARHWIGLIGRALRRPVVYARIFRDAWLHCRGRAKWLTQGGRAVLDGYEPTTDGEG